MNASLCLGLPKKPLFNINIQSVSLNKITGTLNFLKSPINKYFSYTWLLLVEFLFKFSFFKFRQINDSNTSKSSFCFISSFYILVLPFSWEFWYHKISMAHFCSSFSEHPSVMYHTGSQYIIQR